MLPIQSKLQPYFWQVYLRKIARKHVKGEVNTADIEMDVKRKFGIDITGGLSELQEPMVKSRVCNAPRLAFYHFATPVRQGTHQEGAVAIFPSESPLPLRATGNLPQGCGHTGGHAGLQECAGNPRQPT